MPGSFLVATAHPDLRLIKRQQLVLIRCSHTSGCLGTAALCVSWGQNHALRVCRGSECQEQVIDAVSPPVSIL